MKNDIKDLPFDRLLSEYKKLVKAKTDEQMELAISIAEGRHEEKIKMAISNAIYNDGDSEAGSDGIEESVRESVGTFNPNTVKLSPDTTKGIEDKSREQVMAEFCQYYAVANSMTWLPFQLISYFGTWVAVKDAEGKYSPLLTIKENCKDDWTKGILMFATSSRSPMFAKAPKDVRQYKSPINPLVPIVLAGFKQSQNIKYMDWSQDGMKYFMDEDLLLAASMKVPELSEAEILGFRNQALTTMTGDRAGRVNDPITTAKINGLGVGPLGHLPKLTKIMIIQTWCAHPVNQTKLGIYNPENWDVPRPQLVTTELVTQQITRPSFSWTSTEKTSDTPW